MKKRLATLVALVTVFVLNSGAAAMACPFCGAGDPGDGGGGKMVKAAGWGIFAMVIIMFAMLGTLIAFGFYLNYRARHPLPDYQELLGEGDAPPSPNPHS